MRCKWKGLLFTFIVIVSEPHPTKSTMNHLLCTISMYFVTCQITLLDPTFAMLTFDLTKLFRMRTSNNDTDRLLFTLIIIVVHRYIVQIMNMDKSTLIFDVSSFFLFSNVETHNLPFERVFTTRDRAPT